MKSRSRDLNPAEEAALRERERMRRIDELLSVRCEPDPGFVARFRQRRDELSPVSRWTFRELGFRLAAATLLAIGITVFLAWPEPAAPAIADLESEAFDPPPLPGLDPEAEIEPVLHIALGGGVGNGP